MNGYLSIKKTALLLGKTTRHIRRMCSTGELPGAMQDNSSWLIPKTAHPLLAGENKISDPKQLQGIPARKRDEAFCRAGTIESFEKFAADYIRGGNNRCQAFEAFCSINDVPMRTLKRWINKYRLEGVFGLVDNRGKNHSKIISPEAFEAFKTMYLTRRQLPLKICWQNIKYINKSEEKSWQIPSLREMYRFVDRHLPLPVIVLHREGLRAYQAKCAPYIQSDPDSVKPGQIWVGDHHQFNCWIRYRNRWIRPWITAWEDMRSRTIVGRHISACPNQTTILLAMKRAIDIYGPPDSVKIDNGKDYDSEIWTGSTKAKRRKIRVLNAGYIDELMVAGIYVMMNVGVSFALPYHPQAKPVEPWFNTLDIQFTKTIPTYCGKDAARRPEELNELLKSEKAIAAAYNLDSFAEILGQYVEVYNHSSHSGKGMEGKTPAEMLATRESRRVMLDGVSDLLLRVWSGELIVGKNGVQFRKMWYGQYDMELAVYQGKKVRLAYDPDDMRKVDVYDATTMKLITSAEQNQLIRYGQAVKEESFREATRQKAHALKVTKQYRDSSRIANTDLTSLTIKAMQEGAQKPSERPAEAIKSLRPVLTPFDGQIAEHRRREIRRAVKKAAGAESIETVLDIDLSLLRPKQKHIDLGLFSE